LEGFWPAPVTLSSNSLFSYAPDITVSADGQRQAAVWTTSGPTYRTQAAASSDGGVTWSAPKDLSVRNETIGNASLVASDDGQRLTAVWIQFDPYKARVFASRSSDASASWSAAAPLSQFDSGATMPFAATSSDGNTAVVIWTEQGIAEAPVYSARWMAQTNTWSSPALVTSASEYAAQPAIAVSGNGQLVTVLWRNEMDRLRSTTSTDAGLNWSTPRNLSTSGLTAFGGRVRTSTTGSRIVATWVEGDDGVTVPNHVASSFSTDQGQTWSPPQALPKWWANWAPEFIASPDAMRLSLVWPAPAAQSSVAARTSTSSDGGVTWTQPVDASPAGVDVSEPQIAGSNDGRRLTVMWYETPPTQTFLRAAVSGDAGKTWSAPATVTSSPGFDGPSLQVQAAADGTPSAVWQQFPAQSVIRTATAELVTVPDAPTAVTAAPGDGLASIAWSPPGNDGGRPVTSYTATALPGGASCQSATTTCTIPGLTNGTEYQVSVTATNLLGVSSPSAPVSVKPAAAVLGSQSAKTPPKKLKKGKKAKLAKSTTQGAKITWKTTTKKRCTVKKAKVTAKRKGKCKLSAKAPGVPGFTAFSAKYTIRVR
jgi:hypothetical protein